MVCAGLDACDELHDEQWWTCAVRCDGVDVGTIEVLDSDRVANVRARIAEAHARAGRNKQRQCLCRLVTRAGVFKVSKRQRFLFE